MQAAFNELVGTTVSKGSTTTLLAAERAELSRELSSLTPDVDIAPSQVMDAQASDTVVTGSACQSMFGTCKIQIDAASKSANTMMPMCAPYKPHTASEAAASVAAPACIH